MATIVISYRRDDSKWMAGRIFDRLDSHYGKGNVFMDIDSIPFGLDFRDHIRETLKHCDVLLAVIGPNWLGEDKGGGRLLEDTDWVKIEIEAALAKKIPVIPVLIDGSRMPKPSDLPETLRDLAFRQAADVDTAHFRSNMDRVIFDIDQHLSKLRGSDTIANEQPIGLEPNVPSEVLLTTNATSDGRPPPEVTSVGGRPRMSRIPVVGVVVSAILIGAGVLIYQTGMISWLGDGVSQRIEKLEAKRKAEVEAARKAAEDAGRRAEEAEAARARAEEDARREAARRVEADQARSVAPIRMTSDDFKRELVGRKLCGTPTSGPYSGKALCTIHHPDGSAELIGDDVDVRGVWEIRDGRICRRNKYDPKERAKCVDYFKLGPNKFMNSDGVTFCMDSCT
jgi:hypothetical protein